VPDHPEANLSQTDTFSEESQVNAAFLLVTSACFAGQTPEVIKGPVGAGAPPAKSAPVVSTVVPGGCGSAGCSSCCESSGHRLFGGGRLSGLFRHGDSCDCGCSTGGHTQTWSWNTHNSCDTCGSGHGGGLLARFRGGHGSSSCCDAGCSSCAPSAPAAPAPAGEIINTPPKKMPAPTPAPKTTSAPGLTPGLTPAPTTTFAPMPTITPSSPIIEVVPPTVPAVPSVTNQPRSPF
jgi:hypothetical protein